MTQARVPPSPWFHYADGQLHCAEVPLHQIAEEVGTPAYVYAGGAIDSAFQEITEAMSFSKHLIAYAVKANGNLTLLARLAAHGACADIVSEGELARALKAGFSPDKILFSGVGKQASELRAAIGAGVSAIHIENEQELPLIDSIAQELGAEVNVAIRVNPDVDAQTHPYIATGLHSSKFGLSLPAARKLRGQLIDHPRVRLHGVAMHIGSQLSSPAPLREAVAILGRFAEECVAAGADIQTLDVGGGWPLSYGHEETAYPPHAVFGEAIREGLAEAGIATDRFTLLTEPGRALVGDAGLLLTRVLYTKTQGDKRFVIIDAALTELIRPALYQAYHAIMPAREPSGALTQVDVVGPVCESGDFIARDRALPALAPGDLLGIRGAGAYAREMASSYNGRPAVTEVLVDGQRSRVIRARRPVESLWAGETLV